MTINLRAKSMRHRSRWQRYAMDHNVKVIGDGRVIKECFYYDGRRRIAGVHKIDADGNVILDRIAMDIAVEFKKFRRLRIIHV